MTIRERTTWQYVGPNPGSGLLHLVTECAAGIVITWGEPVQASSSMGRSYHGGYSWMGPIEDFIKNFKRR